MSHAIDTTTELHERLSELAYRRSQPFCYSCYQPALSGRCSACGSDDLMRELSGEGVEYGTDWIVETLIRQNLIPVDTSSEFEAMISEFYPETTRVGWLELDTVGLLKSQDSVSWELAVSEWVDSEVSEGRLVSFDNGDSYFSVSDVEQFLDSQEV